MYYRTVKVGDLDIFYREAGPPNAPTPLLLHGFPTSSQMFRNLMPALADQYHLIAPDYPGYGYSSMPPHDQFACTFDNLARVIDGFTAALGLSKYALSFRTYQPPMLIAWGKHDQIFPPAGAEPYKRDLKTLDFHLIDAGHFVLETDCATVAKLMRAFLAKYVAKG